MCITYAVQNDVITWLFLLDFYNIYVYGLIINCSRQTIDIKTFILIHKWIQWKGGANTIACLVIWFTFSMLCLVYMSKGKMADVCKCPKG